MQRYERELRLPVRRPAGGSKGSVVATKAELDAWVMASPVGEVFRLSRPTAETVAVLEEFRQRISELHRLREESAELRKGLHASLESLHSKLRSKFVNTNPSPPGTILEASRKARLSVFDAKRGRERERERERESRPCSDLIRNQVLALIDPNESPFCQGLERTYFRLLCPFVEPGRAIQELLPSACLCDSLVHWQFAGSELWNVR